MISGSQKSFLTETVVFSLSNDGRKVWDTVLFLIEIMHKNHTCQFFLFFPCHVCRTTTCWDPESLLPWQPGLPISPPYYKGAQETGLNFVPQSNLWVQFDTTHAQIQNDLCYPESGEGSKGGGGGDRGSKSSASTALHSWLPPFFPGLLPLALFRLRNIKDCVISPASRLFRTSTSRPFLSRFPYDTRPYSPVLPPLSPPHKCSLRPDVKGTITGSRYLRPVINQVNRSFRIESEAARLKSYLEKKKNYPRYVILLEFFFNIAKQYGPFEFFPFCLLSL